MNAGFRNKELIKRVRDRIEELELFLTKCKPSIIPLVKSSIKANKDLLNFLLYKSGYQ